MQQLEDSDEAPGIYEETNQDLVRLVDAYGRGGAGPGPCERRAIVRLGGGLNGEWHRALAGALGLERLEELYDADDVSYKTEQCQVRRDRMHKKRHHESAEETRLRDELHRLKAYSERAAVTLEYAAVAQLPRLLIKVFIQLRQTRLDLALATGERAAHGDVSQRLEPFRGMVGRADSSPDEVRHAQDQFHGDQRALELAAFVPLTFFTLYWDNRWTEANGVDNLFAITNRALHSTQDQIYALRPVILKQERAPPILKLAAVNRRAMGSESVDVRAMMTCYADDRDALLRDMLEQGCRLAYGTHMAGQYAALMTAYLVPSGRSREDPLQRVNIFAGTDEDPDGHPQPVWRAVRALLPDSATRYEGNETLVRDALIAHFLWCYVTRASLTRLALDWARHGRVPSGQTLRLNDVNGALDATRQVLGEYHSMVMLMMLEPTRSPLLVQGFFKRPLRMMVFDFSVPHELDALNELFGTATSVLDLVRDPELHQQLASSSSIDVAYYRSLGYPVLLVSGVLEGYMHMMRDVVVGRLSLKVREAEAALSQLVTTDRNGEDEVEEVEEEVASTALRLRPDIEAAVQLAYNKVQRFCKGLKGLPRAQLESPHAAESGLQTDFVAFVRALSDERGLLRTKGKRSPTRYQMRGVMMTTTEALLTLKRYRFRKIGIQRFRIYHIQ